jgi:septum site-determining protein MinC
MNTDSLALDFKSATLYAVRVVLHSGDLERLTQALDRRMADAGSFFENEPVVIDASRVAEPLDWAGIVAALRGHNLPPIGVVAEGDNLRAAQAAGLAPVELSMATPRAAPQQEAAVAAAAEAAKDAPVPGQPAAGLTTGTATSSDATQDAADGAAAVQGDLPLAQAAASGTDTPAGGTVGPGSATQGDGQDAANGKPGAAVGNGTAPGHGTANGNGNGNGDGDGSANGNDNGKVNDAAGNVAPGAPAGQPMPTREAPQTSESAAPTPVHPHSSSALVITRPLRSGQRVYARHTDLVVIGMVSQGAEVIADGNVHIYGPLRGKAMAGARGDTSARVFTTHMDAELLAVAGVYRVVEDRLDEAVHGKPALVRLDGDTLRIEALKA